nr:enoyl-CoA hydratase/isomerase family protein [uncultured Pseudomonas sp.]
MTALIQMQAPEHVLSEVRNQIGHLRLNRPAGLNALTLDMVRSLRKQLDAWANDPHVRAVVLRGEGPKGFCAGGDIRSLHDSYKAGDDLHKVFFAEEYALDLLIHRYRKPIVVLMDGFTLGGGMGLLQGCDLRVVTERSRLGMPEVGIGYFPDVGGSYFLSRLPGELGTYLGVTGTQIQAADALYCGLADWYVPSDKLAALDQGLDEVTLGDNPLKDLQKLLAGLGTQVLDDAPLASLRSVIDHFFALPDLAAIVEQLRAVSIGDSHAWAMATADLLETRSPLAMAVTLQMIRRARQMSLENCFAMELHLDHQWFEYGDIIEGVRALIIDKDKQPRWNPPTLQGLERHRVDQFFEGL